LARGCGRERARSWTDLRLRCDSGDDLAHPSDDERARVGDERGDHELISAGRHGAANLSGAVVGRSRDGEAIEQEVAETETIDEAGIPAPPHLVLVRVLLLLQPL